MLNNNVGIHCTNFLLFILLNQTLLTGQFNWFTNGLPVGRMCAWFCMHVFPIPAITGWSVGRSSSSSSWLSHNTPCDAFVLIIDWRSDAFVIARNGTTRHSRLARQTPGDLCKMESIAFADTWGQPLVTHNGSSAMTHNSTSRRITTEICCWLNDFAQNELSSDDGCKVNLCSSEFSWRHDMTE